MKMTATELYEFLNDIQDQLDKIECDDAAAIIDDIADFSCNHDLELECMIETARAAAIDYLIQVDELDNICATIVDDYGLNAADDELVDIVKQAIIAG